MDIAIPGIVFGAVGTTGQRCTSTRRVFIHKDQFDLISNKLISAYKQVRIGDPLDSSTLMGPLIDSNAISDFENALKKAKEDADDEMKKLLDNAKRLLIKK